jgi:hypothetical protein
MAVIKKIQVVEKIALDKKHTGLPMQSLMLWQHFSIGAVTQAFRAAFVIRENR